MVSYSAAASRYRQEAKPGLILYCRLFLLLKYVNCNSLWLLEDIFLLIQKAPGLLGFLSRVWGVDDVAINTDGNITNVITNQAMVHSLY